MPCFVYEENSSDNTGEDGFVETAWEDDEAAWREAFN